LISVPVEKVILPFSQIDVQLKRRYDLIPNLVQTAKTYLKHERETFPSVVFAQFMHFQEAPIFEVQKKEERNVPKVSFG